MSPDWRPSPRSPAVSGHPADSPAVPESVLEPRRHQGIPAGAPAHPCAVTRSQLHRRSDGPRAERTTDEDASAATIQEDPVGSIMPVIKIRSLPFGGIMPDHLGDRGAVRLDPDTPHGPRARFR